VKERILKYLLDAGRGVAADRILRDVFNIHSPNAHSSDGVLSGFLAHDPRFVFNQGLWFLSPHSREPMAFDFGQAVILHMHCPSRCETLRDLRGAIRYADGVLREFTASASIRILGSIRANIKEHLLIVWSSRELQLWNRLSRSKGLEAWQGDTLYLRNLAASALKRRPSMLHPEDMASELGISPADEERLREVIQHLHACWVLLLNRIPAEFRQNPGSLREWMDGPKAVIDFNRFAFGPDFLRQLPSSAGVYMMKDREGAILYVGKSRNLKRRVSSYFTPRALCHPKIAKIHERMHSIDIHRTDNEIEALVMEMRLIKDFRPDINLQTEIHQRQADRYKGRNLLLFVVDAVKNGVKIYFFRNGIFAGRSSATLCCPPSKRLREKLQSLYFAQGKSRKRPGEVWEKEIVSRWLIANQRRLNFLDVDEGEDFASVLKQLRHYLCDPDKLTRKVYYR
jgi:hypothetical protein